MNQLMQDVNRYTSLSRPLDPVKYRTNLYIIVLTLLAGVAAGAYSLLQGTDLTEGLRAGFYTGAAAFIAWVYSREIDPDRDAAAFVSVLLAVLAMFALAFPDLWLLPLATCVIILRILSRTVGPPAKPGDAALAIILAVLCALTGAWPILLIVMLGFLLDALLWPTFRLAFVYVLIVAIVLVGFALLSSLGEALDPSLTVVSVAGLISLFFAAVIYATRSLVTQPDLPGFTFSVLRIQATMMLLLTAGLAMLFWYGDAGFYAMLPVWATCLGIGIYRLLENMRQRVTAG